MRFLLGTFLPLSFKTYGIAFIVMVTLFFGLASWFTLNKIHSTQIEIERNSQRAASCRSCTGITTTDQGTGAGSACTDGMG